MRGNLLCRCFLGVGFGLGRTLEEEILNESGFYEEGKRMTFVLEELARRPFGQAILSCRGEGDLSCLG